MADQRSAKVAENGVSPYLQRPLRSFEQAQQDHEHQTADTAAGVRTVTSDASPVNAGLRYNSATLAELPKNISRGCAQ